VKTDIEGSYPKPTTTGKRKMICTGMGGTQRCRGKGSSEWPIGKWQKRIIQWVRWDLVLRENLQPGVRWW